MVVGFIAETLVLGAIAAIAYFGFQWATKPPKNSR